MGVGVGWGLMLSGSKIYVRELGTKVCGMRGRLGSGSSGQSVGGRWWVPTWVGFGLIVQTVGIREGRKEEGRKERGEGRKGGREGEKGGSQPCELQRYHIFLQYLLYISQRSIGLAPAIHTGIFPFLSDSAGGCVDSLLLFLFRLLLVCLVDRYM